MTESQPQFLQLLNLQAGYSKKTVLSGISCGFEKGTITSLIGPNGAGKTTLLRTLTRQLALEKGAIYLDGKEVREYSPRQYARRLSLMTAQAPDPDLMTCQELVFTGRYPYTGSLGLLTDKDRQAARESMELMNITDLGQEDFKHLSDGQRQRVLLARAICQEPEVLVLDEPTSFLDIRHKLELLDLIQRLVRQKGLTLILSLHELDLAQKVSDQVICLKSGTIDRWGSPDEIFMGDYIQNLYGLTCGTYNELFGSTELAGKKESPEIFVIGGGGTGIPVYRRLQRKGIAFATGILYENDIDFQTASCLASATIHAPAFEPAADDLVREALDLMLACRQVICPRRHFGTYEAANQILYQRALEEKICVTCS